MIRHKSGLHSTSRAHISLCQPLGMIPDCDTTMKTDRKTTMGPRQVSPTFLVTLSYRPSYLAKSHRRLIYIEILKGRGKKMIVITHTHTHKLGIWAERSKGNSSGPFTVIGLFFGIFGDKKIG